MILQLNSHKDSFWKQSINQLTNQRLIKNILKKKKKIQEETRFMWSIKHSKNSQTQQPKNTKIKLNRSETTEDLTKEILTKFLYNFFPEKSTP